MFAALADPTRRRVLELLAETGPLTATALTGEFSMSRQAVVKHLNSLSAAGLVTAERRGREVFYAVGRAPLGEAVSWLETIGASWDRRLVALVKHLSDRPPPGPGRGPAMDANR